MAIEKIIKEQPLEKAGNFVNTAERINNFEQKTERSFSSPEKPKEAIQRPEKSSSASAIITPANDSLLKKRAAAIDDILAEGLNEVYLKMDVRNQQEFKKRGEETVDKINQLLSRSKVKVGKIIDLIKSWLKIIPGINKFFLEQESKIKADKILNIKDKF